MTGSKDTSSNSASDNVVSIKSKPQLTIDSLLNELDGWRQSKSKSTAAISDRILCQIFQWAHSHFVGNLLHAKNIDGHYLFITETLIAAVAKTLTVYP